MQVLSPPPAAGLRHAEGFGCGGLNLLHLLHCAALLGVTWRWRLSVMRNHQPAAAASGLGAAAGEGVDRAFPQHLWRGRC
jgi:hypothetical protein